MLGVLSDRHERISECDVTLCVREQLVVLSDVRRSVRVDRAPTNDAGVRLVNDAGNLVLSRRSVGQSFVPPERAELPVVRALALAFDAVRLYHTFGQRRGDPVDDTDARVR